MPGALLLTKPFLLLYCVETSCWPCGVGGGISIFGRRMQGQQADVVTCLRFYSQKRSWSPIRRRYSASISIFYPASHALCSYSTVLWGFFNFIFLKLKSSWFTVVCQSLLYSRVTQLYTYRHSSFHILFHYGLSQDIEYSSLCYTVGPCCLPPFYI